MVSPVEHHYDTMKTIPPPLVKSHLNAWMGPLLPLLASTVLALGIPGSVAGDYPAYPAFDEEMRSYKATEPTGAIASLHQQMESGAVRLTRDSTHGYLASLLRELNVPASSQLLVASKTSPNKALISPKNPRALYFNDQVSVAYVPSAELIEVAAADPRLGVVFYTLAQKPAERPRLVRDDRCLECHASAKTLNVPGILVRSFLTKDDGEVELLSGLLVDHRTPLADRWGGYYVTGQHGRQTHRGNLFGTQAIALHEKDPSCNANITDLTPLLDIGKYPSAGSDIVALLTHEHQAHAQNLLTRIYYDSLAALRDGGSLRPAYPAIEAALRYMLFVEEAPLTMPVKGTSHFAAEFQKSGPGDSRKRSLRQLNLQTRLFEHPCSYMIYSTSFEALPQEARRHFYRRLWDVLNGEDPSLEFAKLGAESRRAIREILLATKKDLPAYWRL